jgi:hypothetical protein
MITKRIGMRLESLDASAWFGDLTTGDNSKRKLESIEQVILSYSKKLELISRNR